MKIALIGAGFVGTAVLKEALERNHEVTLIIRDASKVFLKNDKLNIKETDATNVTETASLLKDHDVVVSTFNAGWTNPNLYHDFLEGSKKIQEAVKQSGVKRYFVVLGAGSLYIKPGVQLVDTPEFPKDYKSGAQAARNYLNELKKETELEWTVLSPAIEFHPGMQHGKKGTYRTGIDEPVFDNNHRSTISPEDIALAIIDELEHPKYTRQRFTVGY